MKTRYLSLIVTLILLLLVVSLLFKMREPAVTPRSNDSDNPYIYYYSDIEHAFVIERADGTDSRLLAQNVMADEFDIVHSVQWSPSGKWMSWLGRVYAGPGDSPTKAWVISTDGQTFFELSDNHSRILFLSWSTTQDYVFVIIESNTGLTYRIVDVNSKQVLGEQHYLGIAGSRSWLCCFPEEITWTEDGSGVAYPLHGQDFEGIAFMQTTGIVLNRYFDEQTPLLSFNHYRFATYDWGGTSAPNMLQIEDSITGQSIKFEIDVEYVNRALHDFDLFWNPDLSYALVADKECEGVRCQVVAMRLLDWNSGTQQMIPGNLDVTDCVPYEYCETGSIWSVNGEIAVLQDANNQLKLLNVVSAELYSVSVDDVHSWYWLNNNDLLIVQGDYEAIYRYDWQTHTTTVIPQTPERGVYGIWGIQPSQDGLHIGYMGLDTITIQNTETGVQQSWANHSASAYGMGPVRGYKWQEDGEWFFSGGNTMYSGGLDVRAIMLHHIGNPLRRELTLCFDVFGCTGFVPDHALQYLSQGQQTSYIEAPIYTMLHDDAVWGVAWSPDGTHIASYANSLNIWDISGSEPTVVEQFDTDFVCAEHPTSCNVIWQDTSTIILSGYRREIELWDILNRTSIRIEKNSNNPYLLPEYPYIVRQSDDRQSYEIVASQTETVLATAPASGAFNSAIWQDDGHAVLINQTGENSYLWDGNQLYLLSGSAYIFDMDYDPQTRLVVGAGAYGRGVMWNIETGEQLKPPNWTGRAVALSPDGTRLAVAGSEFVTIWDMTEYIEEAH